MSWLDRARAKAHEAITKLPGKAGELAQRANDALGRPLADESELADRKAFSQRGEGFIAAKPSATGSPDSGKEVAPVIVYHMDKTRRDALKLVELLEGAGIPHQVSNIQEDAAAQMAVRRDSKGYRLPVVFIAGEAIGGRAELTNMQTTGELKKKVFGA
jgi:hypothetical protein